jgi:carbon-monoxide dehydrogenase medium subunit
MKAAAFDYVRAASVEEAVQLLARNSGRAKLLAGGQSLLPALNLRLMAPELLVDISQATGLRGVSIESGMVRIGALTRHADLLVSPDIASNAPLLAEAVVHIAHPAIRNRGTIGGSLAHADPAAELPACMLALDAALTIRGPSGERRVKAADFFTGLFETQLAPDEILVAIEFPAAGPAQRSYFHEYARRMGDYAIIGLAACATIANGGFRTLRLAYFGAGDRATLCPSAAQLLIQSASPAAITESQTALANDLQPQNDHQASAAMRLHLARTLLSRCVHQLVGLDANAEGGAR